MGTLKAFLKRYLYKKQKPQKSLLVSAQLTNSGTLTKLAQSGDVIRPLLDNRRDENDN